MKVQHVMTPDAVVVSPHASVQEAARLMDQINVGALPVCDGNRLVGIITDRDITVRCTAAGMPPDRTPVAEVMTGEVRWCFEDDAIEDVEREMAAVQIRRIPVLDHAKNLVGIVSLGDLATDDIPGTLETLQRISETSEPDRPEPNPSEESSGYPEQRPGGIRSGNASRPVSVGDGTPAADSGMIGLGASGTDLHERYQSGYGSDEPTFRAEDGGTVGSAPEAVADGAPGDGAVATEFDRGYGDLPREGIPDRPVFDRAQEEDPFAVTDPSGGSDPQFERRSDERIVEEVKLRLSSEARFDATSIDVAVYGTDVTLSGTVRTAADARQAQDIAEAVSGVNQVQNNLRIQP